MKSAALLIILISATAFAEQNGSFTDKRDGKTYRTVKIGEQVWFAENLNYQAAGSRCYKNNPDFCEKYGRLYNWETALEVCPNGWHLPTIADWDKLYRFADGTDGAEISYESETAGKHLKSESGWNAFDGKPGNGDDKFGFAGLPGGYGLSVGYFLDAGSYGLWWSAAEDYAGYAYYRGMYYYYDTAFSGYYIKSRLYSVRCMQD